MNGSVAQQYTKLKRNKTALILNLYFTERELRLKRLNLQHILQFGPHKTTSQTLRDLDEAYKDNSETDDLFTKRFKNISTEGVNL